MAISAVSRVVSRAATFAVIVLEEIETFLAKVHANALRAEVEELEAKIDAKFDAAREAQFDALDYHAKQQSVIRNKTVEADLHG